MKIKTIEDNNQPFEKDVVKKDISFTLEDSGELIGGLVGAIYGDYFEIDVLAISKKYRKKGDGTKLLLEAEKYAKKNNCKYLFLYTTSYQGVSYYPRFGFKINSVIDNYPLKDRQLVSFIKEI